MIHPFCILFPIEISSGKIKHDYSKKYVNVTFLYSKRRPNDGQTHSVFNNPAYREDPIYESIPEVTGSSVPENIRQATDAGLQELRFPDDKRNKVTNTTPISNGLYDVVGGNSPVPKIEDPKKRYAIPGGSNSPVPKIEDPKKRYAIPGGSREKRYASLFPSALAIKQSKGSENRTNQSMRNDEKYMKLAVTQYGIPRDMTGTKTDEEDYMKPVDGHYKIPRHNGATNNTIYENSKLQDESQI